METLPTASASSSHRLSGGGGYCVDRHGKEGVIIFDGACGACSVLIGGPKRILERYGFAVAPLQSQGICELTGLTEAELGESIQLLLPNGVLLREGAFFQYVFSQIWWLAPLGLALRISIFRRAFDRLYQYVAKRRLRISALCGLDKCAVIKR